MVLFLETALFLLKDLTELQRGYATRLNCSTNGDQGNVGPTSVAASPITKSQSCSVSGFPLPLCIQVETLFPRQLLVTP